MATSTYTVKAQYGRFIIDNSSFLAIFIPAGGSAIFDQSDSSNTGHPIKISTTKDGTHAGGSEYTTGVVFTGTAGSAGAKVQFTPETDGIYYYYCGNHPNMGSSISFIKTVFTDLGATAYDADEGNLTTSIKKEVYKGGDLLATITNAHVNPWEVANISLPPTATENASYTIKYNVTDASSAVAQEYIRNININIITTADLGASTCGEIAQNFSISNNFSGKYFAFVGSDATSPYVPSAFRWKPSWMDWTSNDPNKFPFAYQTHQAERVGYNSKTGDPYTIAAVYPDIFNQWLSLYPNGVAVYWRRTFLHNGSLLSTDINFSQICVGTWGGGGVQGDEPIQVSFINEEPPTVSSTDETKNGNDYKEEYLVRADIGDGNGNAPIRSTVGPIPHAKALKDGASLGSMQWGQEVTLCFQVPDLTHVYTFNLDEPMGPQNYGNVTESVSEGWKHTPPIVDWNDPIKKYSLVEGEGLNFEQPNEKVDFWWYMTHAPL